MRVKTTRRTTEAPADQEESQDAAATSFKRKMVIAIALLGCFAVIGVLADAPTKVQGMKEDRKEFTKSIYNADQSGHLASCVWTPQGNSSSAYRDTPCMKALTGRIRSSQYKTPPSRWLFLGDSTMGRLFNQGNIKPDFMAASAIQNKCPGEVMCYYRLHSKCKLNEDFLLPPLLPHPASWRKPNFTMGEGPLSDGRKNPNCQDCKGCKSQYVVCQRKKSVALPSCGWKDVSAHDVLGLRPYGGYFSVEFARDVEIQTPDYDTTQENVALFLQKSYNTDPWLLEQFGGPPICVVSAGIHDVAIPNITTAQYLYNIQWYVELLLVPCGHVVWLQNTAPMKIDDNDNKDPNLARFKQTQKRTLEWNQAVHRLLNNSQHLPLGRITIVDVYEASLLWTHQDNIHLLPDWYLELGAFFREAAHQRNVKCGTRAEW